MSCQEKVLTTCILYDVQLRYTTTLWTELAASWTQSMLVECPRVNYDWSVPLADACQGGSKTVLHCHQRRDIHIEKPDEGGSRILHAKNKLIYLRFRLPPILLKHYYNHARLLCEAEQRDSRPCLRSPRPKRTIGCGSVLRRATYA